MDTSRRLITVGVSPVQSGASIIVNFTSATDTIRMEEGRGADLQSQLLDSVPEACCPVVTRANNLDAHGHPIPDIPGAAKITPCTVGNPSRLVSFANLFTCMGDQAHQGAPPNCDEGTTRRLRKALQSKEGITAEDDVSHRCHYLATALEHLYQLVEGDPALVIAIGAGFWRYGSPEGASAHFMFMEVHLHVNGGRTNGGS